MRIPVCPGVSVETMRAPVGPDGYAVLAAVRGAVRPGTTDTPAALERTDALLAARGVEPVWLVARRGGMVVGYGRVFGAGDAQVGDVGVVPAERRRRVGSALWAAAEAELRRRGARTALTSWLDASDGAAGGFLRHHGFRERDRAWELVLDLGAFDPAAFPDPVAALAAHGIALTTLAAEGPGDAAVLRRVWGLHNASRRDQPPAEEHAEPIPFDAWVASMVATPDVPPEGFFLARAGDAYVGMTTLELRQAPPDGLRNGYTGVRPDHRGRGVARALKLAAIAQARAQGHRVLTTGQHAANAAMLRVNELLGYRRTSARVRFEKDLSATTAAR